MESTDIEVHISPKKGGWITFPFLAGTMFCLFLSASGATNNLIVYLIKDFNVKSIDAAQINNIVLGCTFMAPVAGAIISDSFFGCYPIIVFSTFFNLLSLILFTLTAAVGSLRPTPCTDPSESCNQPSPIQLTVLYAAVALLSVGAGGTRFNIMTMGANQFDNTKDQDVFFNWSFVVMYVAPIIGATVIVYVQDNVSWVLGFGICTLVSVASLVFLTIGRKYYHCVEVGGSPFAGLARVVVAAVNKRKIRVGEENHTYYNGIIDDLKAEVEAPTCSFKFLNRAAIITDHTTSTNEKISNQWKTCTVQEVEDLKTLLKIIPLWSSSLFLSISIGIQLSLSILEALTMNKQIGSHFSYPPGSIVIFQLVTVAVALPVIDRVVVPICRRVVRWEPTPLQRLGLGHAVNTVAMVASALVEKRRAYIVRVYGENEKNDWVVPMSVLWLMFPLVISGLGEALHFPAQVALYYQEFPKPLKSTATGMVALIVAIGFYASTAVIGLVRRVTKWLPDNINDSKMENVFWMVFVLGAINFGYYLLCAKMYVYKSRKIQEGDISSNSTI